MSGPRSAAEWVCIGDQRIFRLPTFSCAGQASHQITLDKKASLSVVLEEEDGRCEQRREITAT
jgi:hypothetical protein